MKLGDETIESETARDLLGYLIDNPEAQDTLEGIVEWWLLDRRLQSSIAQAKEALDQMIVKGLIIERQGADSRVRYSINGERRHDILALLSDLKDDPD